MPGFEAPVTIGYATSNRSAVVRIPAYAKSPEKKHFELCDPDGTANPYYAYADILIAGIDGIKHQMHLSADGWGPFDDNLYTLSKEEQKKIQGLPTSLEEALTALENDHNYLLQDGVISERLINIWIERKREELKELNQIPNPAEFKKFFDL